MLLSLFRNYLIKNSLNQKEREMNLSWIETSLTAALMVILSTLGIYIALILLTRISGLRSFSKISSFDFAITIAIGSIIASTILSKNPPLLQAIVALGMLYLLQMSVAWLRRSSTAMTALVDNQPLLLMDGTDVLEENLKRAKVTRSDLRGKLREANVTKMNQIKAVVMETTGDISVLHHQDEDLELDKSLLEEVRGRD